MESNGMSNQQELGMVGSTATFLPAPLLGAQAKWEGAAGIGVRKQEGYHCYHHHRPFFGMYFCWLVEKCWAVGNIYSHLFLVYCLHGIWLLTCPNVPSKLVPSQWYNVAGFVALSLGPHFGCV